MQRQGLTPITSDRPELRPIAIDGKTARGSAPRTVGQSPPHLVSAWSVENHLTLGQVATDAQSNEITAISELLQLLDLEGAFVTIDAMGCQKEIATGIVGDGGEYVMAVKENQPHLFEDVRRAFDEALDRASPAWTSPSVSRKRSAAVARRPARVVSSQTRVASGTCACGPS